MGLRSHATLQSDNSLDFLLFHDFDDFLHLGQVGGEWPSQKTILPAEMAGLIRLQWSFTLAEHTTKSTSG